MARDRKVRMKGTPLKVVAIRIDEREHARLVRVASRKKISFGALVRRALETVK